MGVEVAMGPLNNGDDEEQRKIDELYGLLHEERTNNYLENMEKRTTCHTLLHEAAAAGMSYLALEVANLKPSLARKLNHQGLSPMHCALRHGHVRTVRALVAFDSDLIRVKGRDLVTPLHYAAELGETELLAEFLFACPSSVKDLTSRCETAMHVAVRNKRLRACKVLLGWMIRKSPARILSWKDDDGNTVLHTATLTNQPEVMKLLLGHVKVNAKNFQGWTALDLCYDGEGYILNAEIERILRGAKAKRASEVSDSLTGADYLGQTRLFLLERWYRRLDLTDAHKRAQYRVELRTMILGVATLIATATFQGVLSPPGGFWQDDSTAVAIPVAAATAGSHAPSPAVAAGRQPSPHTAGKMIMSGRARWTFLMFNSGAFVTSVAAIIATLFGVESPFMLASPVTYAMGTYILALKHDVTNNEAWNIAVFVVAVVILVPTLATIRSWQKLVRRKVRMDIPGRHIDGFI